MVGRFVLFPQATKSVGQEDLLGAAGDAAPQRQHVTVTGAKTILMVGVDNRKDQPVEDQIRADSIIVLHIPAAHDAAYLVSLPRDTRVTVPAFNNGKQRTGQQIAKLGEAYGLGGNGLVDPTERRKQSMGLLAKTIKEEWGLTFDAAAIVDFEGFKEVVKVLGGVDMYVDQETVSVHIGYKKDGTVAVPFRQSQAPNGGTKLTPIPGVTPQVYHVGNHHLTPDLALDYVRQRETLPNSDYDRGRHQKQFLKAIVKQTLSAGVLANPVKLNQILKVVGQAMTIDNGGIDLEDWIFAMRGIGGDSITTLQTNNGTYNPSQQNLGQEELDETTLGLLEAVRTQKVPEYVLAHPEVRSA
ncbi:LCP family protein [Virgisporangium aliadipatigenens]|uniref:LCP family protein n=1 Tax=Virgisporangium aliadipatigenens TaxID=741659 RepID=UPI001944F1E9|nr:LCP family protein [Virgisporangium aliadipatigenens]